MDRDLIFYLLLLLTLILGVCLGIQPVKGQEITRFSGLVTDADYEDIPLGASTVLQNLKVQPGYLEKTCGFGTKIDTALPVSMIYNLVTYNQTNLTMDAGASGRAYIAVSVDASNLVMPYVWDGTAWDSLTVSKGHLLTDIPTTYHDQDYNPVFQVGDAIWMLPGNVGEISGNECKGAWIGRIANVYFDDLYAPDTGFYGYNTTITNDITIKKIWTKLGGTGSIDSTKMHYVFTVRSGEAESPLIEDSYTSWYNATAGSWPVIMYFIDTAEFNKRYDQIRVYRAESNPVDYTRIITADLLR